MAKSYTLNIGDDLHAGLTRVAQRHGVTTQIVLRQAIKLVLLADSLDSEGDSLWMHYKATGEMVQLYLYEDEGA